MFIVMRDGASAEYDDLNEVLRLAQSDDPRLRRRQGLDAGRRFALEHDARRGGPPPAAHDDGLTPGSFPLRGV